MAAKAKKPGFDLGDVLSQVLPPVSDSDTGTGQEQITYLDLTSLDEDKANFYHVDGIADLVANIELVGLQQPLRVRPSPDKPDRYVIVSGHRRRRALLALYQEAPEKWGKVPCIVETGAESAAMQELRLIYANAATRKMSSADLSRQAERVEALLYKLKEDGYEFPGRMRDHVAEACRVSKTKLATLSVIRKGLAAVWKSTYKSGALSESAAYELARMDPARQREIYEITMHGKGCPYAHEVTKRSENLDRIAGIQCPQKYGGGPCSNGDRMRGKLRSLNPWESSPCRQCCAKCDNLISCKSACPKLKDMIKRRRAAAKAEKEAAAAEKAAREQPDIDLLQLLWDRWDTARRAAGVSMSDAFQASKRYYHPDEDQHVADLINGVNASANDHTPYHCLLISDVRALLQVAKTFGVDVRYLLGLTDAMTPPDHIDEN